MKRAREQIDAQVNKKSKVCENATELDLINEEFEEIPSYINYLTNLQTLYLSFNRLEKVPSSIGNLTTLQKLVLGSNELKELPPSIGNLTNLKILSVCSNKLKEIPSSIGNLSNLEILYLQYNELEQLPSSIGNLSNLKELHLRGNKLTEIPQSITKLTKLEHLDVCSWTCNEDLIYPPRHLLRPFCNDSKKQAKITLKYCTTHGPPLKTRYKETWNCIKLMYIGHYKEHIHCKDTFGNIPIEVIGVISRYVIVDPY